jgi:hypothetical protein
MLWGLSVNGLPSESALIGIVAYPTDAATGKSISLCLIERQELRVKTLTHSLRTSRKKGLMADSLPGRMGELLSLRSVEELSRCPSGHGTLLTTGNLPPKLVVWRTHVPRGSIMRQSRPTLAVNGCLSSMKKTILKEAFASSVQAE